MRDRLRGAGVVVMAAWTAARWRAVAALLLSVGGQAINPLTAVALGLFTDAVVARDVGRLWVAVGVYAGFLVMSSASGGLGFPLRMEVRERTMHYIDQRLVNLTGGAPGLEHFERPEFADKVHLLREDRQQLAAASDAVTWNIAAVMQVFTTTLVLANLHPLLFLLPLFGVPTAVIAHRTTKRLEQLREDLAERGRIRKHLFTLGTTPPPAKEIRVFGLGAELLAHRDRVWRSMERDTIRANLGAQARAALGWMIFAVGYVASISLLVSDAVAGRTSVGAVVIAVGLAAQVRNQVSQIAGLLQWFLECLKTVDRYVWLERHVGAEAERMRPDQPFPAPKRLRDGIRVEGVSFVYPGTEREVLTDVNVHLPASATVALVGDNGAGKTTLVKLLARYYDPTAGRILLDGVDLRTISVEDWRTRLSAGFQDFARLELLAREAVGVGHLPEVDDIDAVAAALGRAAASEMAGDLPAGLETMLGRSFEGGVELSGGQWQKLALGRAMMREEPLLVLLDEPTASLDPQTEHALFERYAGAARRAAQETGGITLLVSHRFSTVRMADLIVVLDGNRVAEVGDHAELMRRRGLYAELFELQAVSYR